MPFVNYCKKCKTEVPAGDTCPYCGAKLTQASGQISYGLIRRPVQEWFEWNNALRIVLPVLLIVLVIAALAEAAAGGIQAVAALLTGGFLSTIAGLLAAVLAALWAAFTLQGVQNVHVVLDKQGLQVRIYIPEGKPAALYAHFLTEQSAQRLAQEDSRSPLAGLVLVRRILLPWTAVSRVRIWREGNAILFFRPTFWQAAAIRVPLGEMEELEAFLRKKLKKKVQPSLKTEKKKKK